MTPLWPTGIEKKNEFGFRAAKKSNPAIERTILLHDKNKTVAVRTKSGRSQNRRNTVELWAAEPGRGECRQNGRRQGPSKWRLRLLSPPGATELRLRVFLFLDLVHAECAVPRPQSPKPNRLVVVVFFVRVCVSSSFSSVAGRTARR